MNKQKIEEGAKLLIEGIGEDLEREGIKYTPTRVARLFEKRFYRYFKTLKVVDEAERNTKTEENVIPVTVFNVEKKELTLREMEFESFCEHHLVPFTGRCWIGIIPNKKLIGLNKIDTVVKYFSSSLQLQEKLASEIADWFYKNLEAKGVMVIMEASHLCAVLQGDKGNFKTSAVRGIFEKNPETRAEFISLIK